MRRSRFKLKPCALIAASVSLVFAPAPLWANPTGPSVVSGSAAFSNVGSTLTVTNSPNAIINWQGFSIGAGEATRFQQQSAASAVLNRVVGQDPSAILGTLWSNGRVFLVNPNGMLFGQGSRVDVAGLVASTLNITDSDFLGGRLNFQSGVIANSLVNQGELHSATGGHIYLIAPDVTNSGLITSPKGEVVLAAGKSVSLVDIGTPNLKVEISAPDTAARNLGQIVAESGRIGVYAGLINQSGVVRADSVSKDTTGKIVFRASDTTILDTGSVTSAAGAKGGEIQVLGNKVGLVGSALVDASGEAGGGTVLIGGDLQGKNLDIQNAWRTYVGPDATIKADAITSGDGGNVIVWSDDATRVYGSISARGGAQGGNGGFVETSGHYLEVTRAPDLSASQGKGGIWLLDPFDITIDVTSDQNISNVGSGSFFDYRGTASPSVVSVATILSALSGGGNVNVNTTGSGSGQGNITVNAAITTTQATAASLTLRADNNIQAAVDILLGSNVDLSLIASNNVAVANLGGKNVSVTASNGAITTGTVSAGSSLYMNADGAVQPGAITSGGYVQLQSYGGSVTVPNITTTGGSISVYSFDDLSLASTLSTPYGVTLQVAKPGGVLTMLAGSAVNGNTQGFGYSTSLSADDMVLGGAVNMGSNGYVYLNPYSNGRDVNIGAGTLAGALNLAPAELASITAGTLTVGSYYYGDLTVASALAPTDLNAASLQLYGNNITASAGIAVSGDLYLQANNRISTGNLSGDYVQVYAGGGGIATGTVSAGSSLYMSADGAVQPGAITAGGYVSLSSSAGGVTVPNISTTGGSMSVYSFDDMSLSGTLNSPYGVTLQVAKPGGVLTMLAGSAVNGNTQGFGYSTSLTADDMVLGGTVNNGSNGSVQLNPYSSGRDTFIGTGTVSGALNLTPAELATLTAGTLTIGSYYYGNLTVASAIAPADINAVTLQLYGNNITASAGIAVSGDLYLQANNRISTGNLSGDYVQVYAGGGGIATGTVSAGSSLYMNADGAVQPGAISATGGVYLNSSGGAVTLSNITSTGGSISVYSFDDLSLASTLSTPYGVTLQVAKPGGVLTMLAGSAVNGNTQGFGYSTSLSADDMVLGGAVNMGSNGYVYLNPYSNGRDVNIGAGTLAGALNLAPAELASITAGTLTVGSYYYGDLTVTSPISSTSLNATNLYLSGNNIALGASLGVSGSLSISASYNIDGNTTASPLDLTANQVSLAAYSGRIYRSGTGVTNINGVTNPTSNSTSYSLYAYLGSDLPGSVTASDVNISVPSGDYTLQTLNGNTVTLSVPAGAIIDGNGSTNNIIANTLNISAANGIGSGDAIETAVRVLNASSGGSGNIEITNIGNLTASITHSGTGGLALTNHGHLQVSAISVPAGNITIGADGRLTAPVAVSTTGALDLSGNGDVTTGNLSGSSVYLSSSGGAISTGTVSAGSSGVSMSARGALQPGAISSTGGVYLNSSGGAVTLSNITSTGSSIYIYSFDDLSLASTLSTPYGVTLQVAKPGGVLTMLSGSAINGNTQDFGYTTYLTADDMVLGGTVNNGSGGPVQLNPYSSGRDVNIGTGTLAGALNLAPAELATITAGTLTVGNYYYGDLTVASAIAPTDLNAASLQLYGNNITASAGIAVSGDLYLQANNRISTGNLSGDYVQVYAGGGGIATGTVSAGSSLYMYANGAVQPGDITAGGYVQLQSTGGSVTVPNITTTGSSIYIYSFDDVSLASTLNSPYGVTLQVAKPGGVLSMLSGSAVNGNTSGYGYSTSLSADDMVLGGTVNNGSNGYVYLNPYSSGRDVNIGTGTLAGALNLTPAELATITAGTLTVGNYYYGDLTVASALATTDIHATTLNLYGNNIALGAGIAVAGDLGIYANNNIDANTTSSTLDLFAFGNVDLIANNGQIFRSGTGVTNIAASTTYIYAPLGVDLGGTISSSDVDITWTSGDYAIGVLTGNSVTLNVTNGGVVDSNGSAVNITAGTLTINATNGIGHGDAIETQVSVLNASSGGSNNIEIANIGNLTVNSLSHTGTGNVILTNSGAMTLGGNVAAPAVRLSAGSSIVQSAGVISATSLTTASVGGTVLSASNAITTFNATNSGSGNIVLYSAAPTLEVTGISQSGGGSVALRANDLNISGLIDAGASLVSIAPYAANGDMFVGNVTGTGLQLSLAELQQINSTNVEFGRSDGTGNLAISLPATTTVAGTLRLLAGGSVNVSGGPYTLQGGTLQMPGTTNLQSGTSVIVQGGTFDASSGTVNVSGAFQASSGAILIGTMNILSGGTLSGGGTIAGNVNNSAGTVAPGASPGILTINGNYVQGPSGTLDMQIGGTTAGTEYDLLIVTGSASLDGTLNTTLINGFVPAAGSTFTLVQSGGALTGTFGSIVPPTGTTASTLYGPTTFELSAQTTSVPTVIEPVFNYTVAATQVTSESLLTVTEPVTVVESTTTEEQKLAKKPPACN